MRFFAGRPHEDSIFAQTIGDRTVVVFRADGHFNAHDQHANRLLVYVGSDPKCSDFSYCLVGMQSKEVCGKHDRHASALALGHVDRLEMGK
ncbi:MAG: hypothetical protein D6741_13125, partial [Planctomycetota bacterium]